jgi:hypothetical protein
MQAQEPDKQESLPEQPIHAHDAEDYQLGTLIKTVFKVKAPGKSGRMIEPIYAICCVTLHWADVESSTVHGAAPLQSDVLIACSLRTNEMGEELWCLPAASHSQEAFCVAFGHTPEPKRLLVRCSRRLLAAVFGAGRCAPEPH